MHYCQTDVTVKPAKSVYVQDSLAWIKVEDQAAAVGAAEANKKH